MFAGVLPRNAETSIPSQSSASAGGRLKNSEGAAPSGAAPSDLGSSSAAQPPSATALIRLESRSFRSASRSISRTRSPDSPRTFPVSRRLSGCPFSNP